MYRKDNIIEIYNVILSSTITMYITYAYNVMISLECYGYRLEISRINY